MRSILNHLLNFFLIYSYMQDSITNKVASFFRLLDFINSKNYKGYDPYDTLNSWIPFQWFGKWGPILAIQFQKRNPINIRPLLGIKKGYNPKAMGLFLHTYSLLYQKTNDRAYKVKADYFFNWLQNNRSKDYQGCGWGYNFPWASPVKYLKPFVPSSVVTGFVCRGILEYYKISKSVEAKALLMESSVFIGRGLGRYNDETGTCISYTPIKTDICFNASLLGAEVLALNYLINDNLGDAQIVLDAVNFVIKRQKKSGMWAYSIGDNGKERLQTDFHQGYILESIYRLLKIFDQKPPVDNWPIVREIWVNSLIIGCKYYREQQFFDDGRSLWRVPKEWPTDIHNQAQGIITFFNLKEVCPEYSSFAHTIADWTIKNMQHPRKGYFYYQKFPTHTHKIPYIRWSQAWMLLAFSYLLNPTKL
jgi:hypothetical protein